MFPSSAENPETLAVEPRTVEEVPHEDPYFGSTQPPVTEESTEYGTFIFEEDENDKDDDVKDRELREALLGLIQSTTKHRGRMGRSRDPSRGRSIIQETLKALVSMLPLNNSLPEPAKANPTGFPTPPPTQSGSGVDGFQLADLMPGGLR